jgi:carbonic anhydrase
MISGLEALQRLREGNARFVANQPRNAQLVDHSRRADLVSGQWPFAIVLGCSDSRVPAELVFDQGFGDLFVIRVAGNIVAPSQVGSVEFAAERYGTPLVVVMGHSQCGAVLATLEEITGGKAGGSGNLRSIVERVRPAVATVIAAYGNGDHDTLVGHAVRANVRASAEHLRNGSPLLERLIFSNGFLVVGAEYSLETGIVDFFDGVPPGAA